MAEGLFIESIRVEEGKAQLLDYHKERIARSLAHVGAKPFFCLEDHVGELIEWVGYPLEDVCKLRFEYDTQYIYNASISPYTPRRVTRLIPVELGDGACYRYKWCNRDVLQAPPSLTLQSEEELIFVCEGRLTDTRYSNIVLDMGDGIWLTPERPLLEGVMRQHLLDEGRIQRAELGLRELETCRAFRLINAMLPL